MPRIFYVIKWGGGVRKIRDLSFDHSEMPCQLNLFHRLCVYQRYLYLCGLTCHGIWKPRL